MFVTLTNYRAARAGKACSAGSTGGSRNWEWQGHRSLAGYLLNWTGFNIALGINQSAKTLLLMRICDIGIPIVTTLVAIYIIATFEVSEDKAYDIRKQLEQRRGKA